jgi:hypothetical protein
MRKAFLLFFEGFLKFSGPFALETPILGALFEKC